MARFEPYTPPSSARPAGVTEEEWQAIRAIKPIDPLSQLKESAAAIRAAEDEALGRLVAQSIDKVREFMGVGIVFRSANGMRRVRLPVRPGDLTLVVMWGPPPPDPPAANAALRHEATLAGVGCAAAVIGWIGFVTGASLSGPVGWVVLSLVIFDGVASGAASISCLQSGVRVLNEVRGNHARNEQLDASPFYQAQSKVIDAISLVGTPRALLSGPRAIAQVGGKAATAARGATAVAKAAAVVRTLVINRETRSELLGAVNAALGLYSSAEGGIIAEHAALASTPAPAPVSTLTFTLALTN